MTNETTDNLSQVKVVEREGISAVWLIPAIALIFGAWLLYKAISDQGISITVQFDSASGIVAGKTGVRYKGLTVGVVTNVEVADDLKSVSVDIEMIPSAANMLTEKTLFWYVTADVSFQGVKGLDTLISGSYINIQPSLDEDADSQREFVALTEEPAIDKSLPGLHLVLQTDKLGSLGKSAPVTYKQIPVGFVESFKYNEETKQVDVGVFIKPEHANLVKKNSRFWNASGIEVNASLNTGVEIRTESLASIIVGGIAFDNSPYEDEGEPAETGEKFLLHPDFQTAEMGHSIELVLEWNSGIDIGAKVMYQGLTLGRIESFSSIDPEKREIVANVIINPRVMPYLTEGTEFYVVSAQFDLAGMSNVSTLLMGSYIGVRFSLSGEEKSRFDVFNQKPAYKYTEPGLHLVLTATKLGSLASGSGIFYRQQQVGNIQAIENIGPDVFNVHIYIQPEYQDFVAADSRFWNVSGLKIKGGLQDFEIEAQSLQSILKGGIAFDKGFAEPREQVSNGDNFVLFADEAMAKQRTVFELNMPKVGGVSRGTRILYRGEEIGAIHNVEHTKTGSRLVAGILPNYEYILKDTTQFWLVEPDVSLSGVTDTEALFGGSYIGLNVGEGETKTQFNMSLTPPAKHLSAEGLQITLLARSGNVVSPGSQISYRGISVGQVDNVALDEVEDTVKINITIDEGYRNLVNGFTRFYNASGITVAGSLTDFVVKTESADAMIRGGISFYNPDEKENAIAVNEGDQFKLHASVVHARKAGQAITIQFNDVAGLKTNTKIKYQDQDVGIVTRLHFDIDGYGATAIAYLNDAGRKFAVEGSKFWFERPELGLVGNKNLSSVIDGGFVRVAPGYGDLKTEFTAEDTAPVTKQLTFGLNLKLVASELGSIRVGNPVLYRQVSVGEVIGVDLSPSSDKVEIYVNIASRYAPLVKAGSKFWNTSGFTMNAGLFSGVKVESESIETILAGGIAFATPEADEAAEQVKQGHTFELNDSVDGSWQNWRAKINISEQ